MRDLFLTARSFTKRLAAFIRYRSATRDMNQKYEDATVVDIQREDTCIICREEMRPWSVTNPQAPAAAPGALPAARPAATVNERTRPKKLPCGHILHLGCLKSWLERQQVCPTCRRPVDGPATATQGTGGAANNANPAGRGVQRPLPGQQNGAVAQPPAQPHGRGMRMLNIGGLRIGFGQGNLQDLVNQGAPLPGQDNAAAGRPRVYGLELGFPRRRQAEPQAADTTTTVVATTIPEHIQQIEQHIVAEIRNLQLTQQELQLVQLLQTELTRIRAIRDGGADPLTANFAMPLSGPLAGRLNVPTPVVAPQMQRHAASANAIAIPSGSADLPPGVTIPEGWTLLPLQRLDSIAPVTVTPGPQAGPAANAGLAPIATTQPFVSPTIGEFSNNTLANSAPTTTNPAENGSVDSSGSTAIHTPLEGVASDRQTTSLSTPNATNSGTTDSSDTTESDNMQGEPILPNWGNSQLFSGSSLTPTATVNSTDPGNGRETTVASTFGQAGSSSAGPSTQEESSEDKGKGKAVTVEDIEDEAS